MKNLKWNKSGFTVSRGDYTALKCKFDNSEFWFVTNYIGWTNSQLNTFKRVAKKYGATKVEVKPLYENGKCIENKVIQIVEFYDDKIKFKEELEVAEGEKRKFIEYSPEELFKEMVNE